MKYSILKTLSAISMLVLMTGLCACGEKEPAANSVEEYVYQPTFTTFRPITDSGYTQASEVKGDVITFIDSPDYEPPYKYYIKSMNFTTNEEIFSVQLDVEGKESMYFVALSESEDGTFSAASEIFDEASMSETLRIYSFDKSGKSALKAEIKDVGAGYGGYINDVMFVGNDILFTSDNYLVRMDESGHEVYSIKEENYITCLCPDKDGNIYYMAYNRSYQPCLNIIEAGKTQKKEIKKFPEMDNIYIGNDGCMYGSSNDSFGKLDLEAGTYKALFKWIDIDIVNPFFEGIEIENEDSMSFLSMVWEEQSSHYERCSLKKVKKENVSAKTELIYGCQYLDYQIQEEIVKFNKKNPNYRIVVKEYLSDDVTDYQKAYDRFNMDMASGTVFDIVQTDYMSSKDYSEKNIFADIYTLMNADADINKADYFENIFKTFETDGKLYSVPTGVTVETMVMPASLADTIGKWDMDALISLRQQYPDISFMGGMVKEYAVAELLMYSYSDYVDEQNAECYFNSEEFIKCLEFANSFPENIDYDNYDEWGEIMKGNIKLSPIYVMDFNEVSLYSQLYGEDLAFVGFPSQNGGKCLVSSGSAYAISEMSAHKDGAWEFIKGLLEYDYQSTMRNGFPILKAALDDRIKSEKAIPKDESHGGSSNGKTMVTIYPASDHDIDAVGELIKSVNGALYIDENIYKIVNEEVQAYFKGSKDVKTVADIIQSRVKIYLQETR